MGGWVSEVTELRLVSDDSTESLKKQKGYVDVSKLVSE